MRGHRVGTLADMLGGTTDPRKGSGNPASWRPWLHQTVQVPGLAVALTHASPALTDRLSAALHRGPSPPDTRRVVLAVMRYLLRAATRATPYGLFAGVAPATAGRAGSADRCLGASGPSS